MGEILAAIPAHNEAKTIGSLVLEARRYADEVAVVDDGSTDGTAWIAEQAGATVIRHQVNQGYGAALRTCFQYARFNGTRVLVILDGDGQHRPEAIPHVIDPVLRGRADICIGSRFLDQSSAQKVPLYRRFGINVLTKLTNLRSRGNGKVRDAQSGFRAYSRRAVDAIEPMESGMGASAEILWEADKKGMNVAEVPVQVDYGVKGSEDSSEGPVRHALGVIVSMLRYVETERPLATFGIPGLVTFMLGIGIGLDVINKYYSSQEPRELAVGLALITILLIVLGMLLSFTALILHAVINAHRRMR